VAFKRERAALFILAGIVVASLVGLLFAAPGEAVSRRGNVAVVYLSGPIAESEGGLPFFGGEITPRTVRQYLERAERDRAIKAVVLRLDSPGGAVAASQEIASMIKDFQERTGKPVVVSMGDMAASGGYYISAYAKGIVAEPGTLTGSIGAIWVHFDLQKLLEEKLGVKPQVMKAGKYKDMFAGFRSLTEEERERVQKLIDEVYNQFIKAVAEGRELPEEEVRRLATGELFTGAEALKLRLVDRLGGLGEAVKFAGELAGIEEPEPVEYERPSFWRFLLNLSSAAKAKLFSASPQEILLLEALRGWHSVLRY